MRKVVIVVGTILALAGAACGGNGGDVAEGSPTGADGQTAETGATGGDDCVDLTGEGDAFTITTTGTRFEPNCFTASASQGITIVNEDPFAHTFTIEDTMVDVQVNGGETFRGEAVSGVLAPGTYEVICRLHPLMTADITVVA